MYRHIQLKATVIDYNSVEVETIKQTHFNGAFGNLTQGFWFKFNNQWYTTWLCGFYRHGGMEICKEHSYISLPKIGHKFTCDLVTWKRIVEAVTSYNKYYSL